MTSPEISALYAQLHKIPKGRVVTYGILAGMIGKPGGARWVGYVLKNLPEKTKLPWHRVINSQGRISLPGERGCVQKKRLEKENVEFSNGRIKLKSYLWNP
jgi:methylated-DNA-protein-cysteine methyltransferase-like protein